MPQSKAKPKNLLHRQVHFHSPENFFLMLMVSITGVFLVYIIFAAGYSSTAEAADYSHINNYRVANSKPKLAWSSCLQSYARKWSAKMASNQTLAHDSNTNLTSMGNTCKSNWVAIGENVGVGPTEQDVWNAFIASSAHRDNILGDYDVVGVGVYQDNYSNYWITQRYIKCSPACGGDGSPPGTTTSSTSGNQLSNSSFSTDSFGSASFGAVRTLNQWNLYAASGGHSSRGLTSSGDTGTQDYVINQLDPSGGSASVTQVVRGYAGKTYTLSAYSKWFSSYGSGYQTLYLDFLNSSWTRITQNHVNVPHAGWTKTTISGTAPKDTYYVRVILYGSVDPTSLYYWDDAVLTYK